MNVKDINNGFSNTQLIWHGTKGTPPVSIFQGDQGFNIVYSSDNNMWGRALYFAVNASYSCQNYSYKMPGNDTYQVFLAEVVLGNSVELPPTGNLYEPPKTSDGSRNYDSVTGHTNGSKVYMVYANIKAYPRYLITYRPN
jgi:hypothetical protein